MISGGRGENQKYLKPPFRYSSISSEHKFVGYEKRHCWKVPLAGFLSPIRSIHQFEAEICLIINPSIPPHMHKSFWGVGKKWAFKNLCFPFPAIWHNLLVGIPVQTKKKCHKLPCILSNIGSCRLKIKGQVSLHLLLESRTWISAKTPKDDVRTILSRGIL